MVSVFHDMLQKVSTPSGDPNEYAIVKSSLTNIKAQVSKHKTLSIADSSISAFIDRMEQLWKISIPVQSKVSGIRRKENFEKEYHAFCSSPSLKKVSSVIQTYLNLSLTGYNDELEYIIGYVFDQVCTHVIGYKQEVLPTSFASSLEILFSTTELECLYQNIKAISELNMLLGKVLCILVEQLIFLRSEIACDSEVELMDTSTLLFTVPHFLQQMFSYYYNELYYIPSEQEEKRENALRLIPHNTEKIKSLRITLLRYPMSCPSQTVLSWGNLWRRFLTR